MASVGTKLTIPFTVGTGKIVGQGSQPELWCLYTTDDASIVSPGWIDASADVRKFDTDRGRESELQHFDAGSAQITLDNRDRSYDPNSNALITPLNRWWLREQFSGETRDLFRGLAESYENSWPDGGWSNAESIVTCADQMKALNLDALPTTSPARDSYPDLIGYDAPEGYWRLNQEPALQIQEPTEVEPNPFKDLFLKRPPRGGKGWH